VRLKRIAVHQLLTKRTVLAHLAVCVGCCCGNVDRGKPEVPLEWLKQEWRRRGLARHVQLTISGCLGPCDLSNVATVSSPSGAIWLGNLQNRNHYEALLNWASQSKDSETLQPIPDGLADFRFDPFRHG
jgi:cobaltochelatase CobN